MFSQIAKLFHAVHSVYANPGAGVSVYSAPDSVLDFYRVSNVRMPLSQPSDDRAPARPLWVWGGGTAMHDALLDTRRAGGKC